MADCIGIIGGGQLGRMLVLAGVPLGLTFRILDDSEESPAGVVADLISGPLDHPATLDHFAEGLHCATFEFENVLIQAVEHISAKVPVYPGALALAKSQDRLPEKELFRSLQIMTAPFAPVKTLEELKESVAAIGLPALLKTRRFGYDGKGQYPIRNEGEIETVWERMGGHPLILEGMVPFDRELSQVSVRSKNGQIRHYPLVENHHRKGILRTTIAPAPGIEEDDHPLVAQSRAAMERVMIALNYVGVLAIEWFQVGNELIANEMAPRVHNTGHWTMDGAWTSQFENHIRAIMGWELGSTQLRQPTVMINLIGDHRPAAEWLRIPAAKLHLYGKSPRKGRKLGHVNLVGDSMREILTIAESVQEWLPE